MLAPPVTSARLRPGASSPAPPPTSDCQGDRQLPLPRHPFPPSPGPQPGCQGSMRQKEGTLQERTEWRFRMMILCAHTSLPPPGPAAPAGGDRFREVEGKSKVAQHIRCTQPCRLGPPPAPLPTQDQADGPPQLVLLYPLVATGSASLSASS